MGTHAITYLSDLGLRFPGQISLAPGIGMSHIINNKNQVVGETDVGGTWHAAIWDAANGLRDLNTVYGPSGYNILPANFTLNAATAINDSGYIIGTGTDGDGHTKQAFLLTPFMPGDANLDGTVNISDLSKVLTNYDKTGMTWADGDFNGDGTVNITDLSNVLTNYDHSLGASAAGDGRRAGTVERAVDCRRLGGLAGLRLPETEIATGRSQRSQFPSNAPHCNERASFRISE